MADITLTRFVDEQRIQVRFALARLEQDSASLSVPQSKMLLSAAVRASQIALIAYFAELTQPRFRTELWPKLLAVGPNFIDLSAAVQLDSTSATGLSRWLAWQQDETSPLVCIQQAVGHANNPQVSAFRSDLVATTSLTEGSLMIATSSSSANQRVTAAEFIAAWAELDTQINLEREQALEC